MGPGAAATKIIPTAPLTFNTLANETSKTYKLEGIRKVS